METAEQIQTPVTRESPAPEAPAQFSEPQSPEPDESGQDEVALTAEIVQLWQIHTDYKTSIKHQTESLRDLHTELGKRLADMKQVLARPGRNGQWSGWLKERKIPRATADRLVAKYERALDPDGNRLTELTEAITEPTEQELQTLLDKVAPKLRRVLRTPTSAYRFIDLLSSSLALDRKNTEEGFVVVKPGAHVAVEQSVPESVPEEVRVETVPIIAEFLAEGSVESAGASTVL